jgi:hypothetical protein
MRFVEGCLLFLVFSVSAWAGDFPRLQALGRDVPGFNTATTSSMTVADFDGDGVDDLVVATASGNDSLLTVYGFANGAYAAKQFLVAPGTRLVGLMAHSAGGATHVFAIAEDRHATEFEGWPLQVVRSFQVGDAGWFGAIDAAVVGDTDADGHDEILVTNYSQGLQDYDLDTLALRWTIDGGGGAGILLTQLDADPALEIVVGGIPGLVYDGATHATEWSYKDGFGANLAPAHAGPLMEFASAAPNAVRVFQAQPYSPSWEIGDNTWNIGAMTTADLDDDGTDDIVVASTNGVSVYDGVSHAVVHSFVRDNFYPTGKAAVVDLDGDGVRELALTIDGGYPLSSVFSVHNLIDGSLEAQLTAGMRGRYLAASAVALPANRIGMLFGSADVIYNAPVWREVDGIGGAPLWQPMPSDTMPVSVGTSFGVSDLGGGRPGFVLSGVGATGERLLSAYDALDHALLWSIDSGLGHPLENRTIVAADVVPRASGQADTGVACIGSTTGSRLFTFALADGTPGWESVGMSASCRGVLAGDFGGGTRLLVAVLDTTLRAYDEQSHLLAWSLPGEYAGATLIDGVAGREFVTYAGSRLDFHDATTRALLRSYDLGDVVMSVKQLDDIHALIVAAGGRLLLVDGADGTLRETSDYLGFGLADGNDLAVVPMAGNSWFVGATTQGVVYRFRVITGDAVFVDGFDG